MKWRYSFNILNLDAVWRSKASFSLRGKPPVELATSLEETVRYAVFRDVTPCGFYKN
jgi:hypothetical protein